MKNITVILPVHRIEESYRVMLDNAIKSVEQFYEDVKLIVVCPPSIKTELSNLSELLEINIVTNNGNTDFCSQINLGIEKCDTEWFSILEVDDEYKQIWLKSIDQYVKKHTDVDVFLPVVRDINVEGKFVNFTNESTWAYGFTEKQGFLDNEVLLDFQNYQISGGLYKTQIIKDNGLLKENIKLTFGYEFLLRLTHNNVKIMTDRKHV